VSARLHSPAAVAFQLFGETRAMPGVYQPDGIDTIREV